MDPVGPNASAALTASSRALEQAIARRDLDALSDLLATSAGLLIGEALQLSYDAHRIRAEVLVTADGLAGSAVDVLGLLLHEAGHALASERGVKDASRQGRYHNRDFKTIAEELGLDVGQDPPFGWTATTLPAATAARYTDALAILGQELAARAASPHSAGGPAWFARRRAGVASTSVAAAPAWRPWRR